MHKSIGVVILTLADLWGKIIAGGMFLLALFGGWRAWLSLRADKLTVALAENKTLKSDIARLLREATIRIDNEQDYLDQIDRFQRQLSEQRTRISDLLNGPTDHREDSKSPDR